MPERQLSAESPAVEGSARGEWGDKGAVPVDDEAPLAGRGPDVLEASREVVDVEDSVAQEPTKHTAVTAWFFRREETPRRTALANLPHLIVDDANFAWVDLSGYTEGDLREIAGLLNLHPVAVHTSLSRWQRPRLDVYDAQYFVTVTIAQLDSQSYRVQAGELDLFVGRNYLVSAHKVPLPLAQRVMARAQQNPTLMEHDSAYLLYIILDELLEHYESLNEHLQDQIERMEERAITEMSDAFPEDLLRFKRYAFALSQLADQHREVFAAFLRPDFPFVGGDDMPVYFRDLEARLSRLLGSLGSAKDAVNAAFSLYVSQVAHRTNHIMKILTVVSTVLLPTTVILSFFGTQFRGVPLYTPLGFIAMLSCILVVTGSILYAFHRRGWL